MARSAPPTLPLAATGVGSLPFTEPEEAVDFVARWAPQVPFWPELPRRAEAESALGAALEACARWVEPGAEPGTWRVRDLGGLEGAAARPPLRTDGAVARAMRRAARQQRFSDAVALKVQSVGPLTLGNALLWNDAPLHATERGRRLVLRLARRAALRRLRAAARLELPLLLQLDDPAFALAHEPRMRALARALWRPLFAALRAGTRGLGLHVCGPLDPRHLRGLELDLLSCTEVRFGPSSSALAPRQVFGGRGGVLLCGVVPTWPVARAAELPAAEVLARDCPEGAAWSGRVLVTASCGLGLLDARAAEASFTRAREVADRLAAPERSRTAVPSDAAPLPARRMLGRALRPARPWVALALQLLGAPGAPPRSAARAFGGPEMRRPRGERIASDPRDRRSLEVELLRLGLYADRLGAALALVRRLRDTAPRRAFTSPLAELRRLASVVA